MKLMTKEIEKKLEKCPIDSKYGQGKDAEVICKFFTPWSNWTWYVLEGMKHEDGEWELYGYMESDFPEFGYFTLSELESITGPWGLKVERDMYFSPCKLGEVVKEVVY